MEEQNWLGQFLRDRRALVAVVIILACFLPFIGSGNATTSLVGVQGQVNAVNQSLGTLGGAVLSSMGVSTGQIGGALNLLLVLYLIPLSAILVVGLASMSRGTRVWGIVNGAVAIVLPFAVPAIAGAIFEASLPQQLRPLLGSGASFTSYGIGVWVIVLLGIAQLALSLRPSR